MIQGALIFTEPGRGFSSPVLGLLGLIKHRPSPAQQTAQQEKFGGWIWVPISMGRRRSCLVSGLSCLAAVFGNTEEQRGVRGRGSARPAALSSRPAARWPHPHLSSNLQNRGWGCGSLPGAVQTRPWWAALSGAREGAWGCEVLAVGVGWVLPAWLAGDGALCTELCRAAPRQEVRWGQGRGQVSVTVGPAPRGRSVLGALAAGASPPGSRALSAPQTSALPFPSQGPPRMQAWEPRWGMRSVCFHGDGHDIR